MKTFKDLAPIYEVQCHDGDTIKVLLDGLITISEYEEDAEGKETYKDRSYLSMCSHEAEKLSLIMAEYAKVQKKRELERRKEWEKERKELAAKEKARASKAKAKAKPKKKKATTKKKGS
jgi:tRNA splicing endonuclease